jgi:5-oxoprolinase (ATP-hydrolysing)
VRPNTGGTGLYHGGNGIHRELQFRRPLTLSILSERRALPPWGASGGSDGARGKNLLQRYHPVHSNGEEDDEDNDGDDSSIKFISLGGRATLPVFAGDTFHLLTPGGGGWGDIDNKNSIITTPTTNDDDTLLLRLSGASLATLAATEADF